MKLKLKTATTILWSLLFAVFLTLKLCGVVAWSWWWVTSPLWGGLAVAVVLGLCMTAIALLILLLQTLIK